MDNNAILAILKQDLQISTTALDEYLADCIVLSQQAIAREGIEVADTIEDGMLVEMYAAYFYRKRREDAPMPRMLRLALNNRKLSTRPNTEEGN